MYVEGWVPSSISYKQIKHLFLSEPVLQDLERSPNLNITNYSLDHLATLSGSAPKPGS